ncbi:hypothetical protein E7T09_00510 [Deinococcus sp. KSM4-11]|uniref:hypothetical protein n=1 Tax=Deinococcus sp. KSM4-11 TaxID=2568654 RepID=UPI0010A553D8|nr:hypothetical protein [Deinococcus sp. KSM4-11]THF87760.1 hypothetical protein E7T09_00510 [Deinococcus sp. KSM4-11]
MTTPPPTRTTPRPFDLRRATSALLLLSGSLALGLTTFWLGSGTATSSATTGTTTSDPASMDDQGWTATTDDRGWTQAAPAATYSSQPAQAPSGLSRGA